MKQNFENVISGIKLYDKQNHEKLEHIWYIKKQYFLKTALFISKKTNISISRSRDNLQSKIEILKLQ